MNEEENIVKRESVIRDYILAYNSFDIDKMLMHLDTSLKLENISAGSTNMSIAGLDNFMKQAEEAAALFSKREQSVTSFKHHGDYTEVEIDYKATLASDLPNGLKCGDQIDLKGKSIFKFKGSKIIELTDIS